MSITAGSPMSRWTFIPISTLTRPGEVLVSRTVTDLVAGSGIELRTVEITN